MNCTNYEAVLKPFPHPICNPPGPKYSPQDPRTNYMSDYKLLVSQRFIYLRPQVVNP